MKRVLFASARACACALSLGAGSTGCYWLATYQDLTSGLGASDAGVDAATPVVVDASDGASFSRDAGLPPPSGAGFCPGDAGPYVYCMDFDYVDAGVLGLGTSQAQAGIVSGTSVSPPSSLLVNLNGPSSGPPSGGAYNVAFSFSPKTTLLEFEIRCVSLDEWVTTLGMGLSNPDGTIRGLNVVMSPSGGFQVQEYIQLDDGGVAQNGHTLYQLSEDAGPEAWHHVILSLTVDDPNAQYYSGLTVDGQVLETSRPLALTWAQGKASLAIGLTYAGGGGPQFYFDNVRADFGL